jgi:ATP-dependent DNA ligase
MSSSSTAYGAVLLKDGDKVSIISRNRKDLTSAYPSVVAAARKLKARQAVRRGDRRARF